MSDRYRDYVSASERLNFTLTGTRPYRGMPLDEQRERLAAERQRSIATLGERWLLHPSHAPRSKLAPAIDPTELEPDTDTDEPDRYEIGNPAVEVTADEFYRYHYDPEPRQ